MFEEINNLKSEILLFDHFYDEKILNSLFKELRESDSWNCDILSRKTLSFGKPYNYSGINYDFIEFPKILKDIISEIEKKINFSPNNCLVNYYYDSKSKMGFHSDRIDILHPNTGILIMSIGSDRFLRFRNKLDEKITYDINLKNNSLFYMSAEIQKEWMHSILRSNSETKNERISLTFRSIQ